MKRATRVDEVVGSNLRKLRIERGMNQAVLAAKAKVTFQQLQKYETGANRVSAGKLWLFAKALECKLDDFFEGCERGKVAELTSLHKRLNRNFNRIESDDLKMRAVDLVQAFARVAH